MGGYKFEHISLEKKHSMEIELRDLVNQYNDLEFRIVEFLDGLLEFELNLEPELRDRSKIDNYINLKNRIKRKHSSLWMLD